MAEESFVYTACPGWGDHDYCALKTIVKDGKIVRTEKTVYPDPQAGRGHICAKGLRAANQPYHKERLLYPLKRAGERGEGKWQRISWDQALDEIGSKLVEIRDTYGPESVAIWNFIASLPPMSGLGTLLGSRFASLFGTTDPLQSYGLDNGPQYASYYMFGNQMAYMTIDTKLLWDSKLLIVWGANPVENQTSIAKNLVEARSHGAKIIDIGLVFDGTAGLADQFIGVKPGSDLYLALALSNYIVSNGLEDRAYLQEKTIATYLVDTSNGQLLKEENGFFLNWDNSTGEAVPIAPEKGEIYAKQPAFTGEFTVDGKTARPVFDLLLEHLSQYTLTEAAKLTGVKKSILEEFAQEYVKAESSYILGALGIRYQNQNEFYRALNLLGALVGNIDGKPNSGVTGGLLNSGYAILFNDAAITRPLGFEANKMSFVRQKDFFEQVQTSEPYPIKAFIKASGNPVHNCPNHGRWVEAFSKMDLVVDIDIWMTDTGELADYVLPDCMPFERYEIICYATYNHIVLQEPAIEPQGEARDATFFYSELAKRVGLGEYFDKTAEEWCALRLETDYPLIAGISPKLTYERLKKEKIVRSAAPAEPPFDPWKAVGFMTPSGRMDIYAERLADIGYGFPTWQPPLEAPMEFDAKSEYPYQFFTGRQRFFMQSMFTEDPLMVKMSGEEPAIRMNPIDARREGLEDGDKIEAYNQRGHVVAILRTNEAIPPGTVHAWFGWRKRQYQSGTYAELLIPLGDQTTVNETAEHWYQDTLNQAPPDDMVVGSGLTGYAGGADTIWDCACAVKKVADRKEA